MDNRRVMGAAAVDENVVAFMFLFVFGLGF